MSGRRFTWGQAKSRPKAAAVGTSARATSTGSTDSEADHTERDTQHAETTARATDIVDDLPDVDEIAEFGNKQRSRKNGPDEVSADTSGADIQTDLATSPIDDENIDTIDDGLDADDAHDETSKPDTGNTDRQDNGQDDWRDNGQDDRHHNRQDRWQDDEGATTARSLSEHALGPHDDPRQRPVDAARSLSIKPVERDPQFGPLPVELVESLQYLINSRELSGEAPLRSRIAVTSSVRGEGVTTVSHALASALADDFESWVCWIDLSWARTGAAPQPTGRPGIFDILSGRADAEDVIRFIPELGVACLGAGTVPANGRNIGRSVELEDLIAFLSKEFDTLVFDMPPVLESTTGLPLFRFVEEYLIVCKSGVTRTDQLESTTAQLSELSLIGTVLNEQATKTPNFLQRMFAS